MSKSFDNLPKVQITQADWDALPEYSLSIPTGFEDGKRWKKYHEVYDRWTIWRYVLHEGQQFIETGIPEIVSNGRA